MKSLSISLILIASVLIGACSNQQMYDTIQINQKNDCLKLPQEAYEKCMESVNRSYGQYEAQRQEAIKK